MIPTSGRLLAIFAACVLASAVLGVPGASDAHAAPGESTQVKCLLDFINTGDVEALFCLLAAGTAGGVGGQVGGGLTTGTGTGTGNASAPGADGSMVAGSGNAIGAPGSGGPIGVSVNVGGTLAGGSGYVDGAVGALGGAGLLN